MDLETFQPLLVSTSSLAVAENMADLIDGYCRLDGAAEKSLIVGASRGASQGLTLGEKPNRGLTNGVFQGETPGPICRKSRNGECVNKVRLSLNVTRAIRTLAIQKSLIVNKIPLPLSAAPSVVPRQVCATVPHEHISASGPIRLLILKTRRSLPGFQIPTFTPRSQTARTTPRVSTSKSPTRQ